MSPPEILRVPGWERFPWLRAGFSTRRGGLSKAYGTAEQNLGWTAEDDPGVVAGNRARFADAVGAGAPMSLVTVGQIHSGVVQDLDREEPPFTTPEGRARLQGDGLVTQTPGRLLAILTADCVPVLVADTRTHAVAAFHAGWRGTVARIVEEGVCYLQEAHESQPGDLIAAIGPCIGACCFEVGTEVRDAFAAAFPYTGELVSVPAGKSEDHPHLDLVRANQRQLEDAGIPSGNIRLVAPCTACSQVAGRPRFFSYRAQDGRTGRMLSAIGAVA